MQAYFSLNSRTTMYIIAVITHFISLVSLLTREASAASIYDPSGHNLTRSLIEMTQESLLQAFGRDMKRKPTKGFTPHEYMVDVYRKLSSTTDSARRSRINTVRGVIDTDIGKEALFRLPHQIFHFDISGIPATDELLQCEFRLLWRPTQLAARLRRQRSLRRKFFKIVLLGISPQTSINGNGTVSLKVDRLASHTFSLSERVDKWISFDQLLRFSRRLRSSNVSVMKLAMYIMELGTGRIIAPTEIGFEKIGRRDRQKGLLVLFSDDTSKKKEEEESSKGRAKRGARRGRKKDRKSHSRRRNKALCRRRKMYVNFDDFGWTNWIIAPKGYDAYYCRGSCAFPIPGHLSPTSHAVIQSTISSMDSRFIEPACCIPDKLKSIAMLYLDHNDRVVYQKKEDMVVVSCACR